MTDQHDNSGPAVASTDDLKARLCQRDRNKRGYYGNPLYNRDGLEAADRIEQSERSIDLWMQKVGKLQWRVARLSAALTQSQDLVDRWINTSSEQHQTIVEMLEALEQSREECANLAAWQCVYTDGKTGIVCDEYGNQFCQQSRDLTQSRAETAAAYERAADTYLKGDWDWYSDADRAIRALATQEQTTALDAIRAEARAQGMRETAQYMKRYSYTYMTVDEILAAIKWAKA